MWQIRNLRIIKKRVGEFFKKWIFFYLLLFPPSIKGPLQYSWNIFKSGIKHVAIVTLGKSDIKHVAIVTLGKSGIKHVAIVSLGKSGIKHVAIVTLGKSGIKHVAIVTLGKSGIKHVAIVTLGMVICGLHLIVLLPKVG